MITLALFRRIAQDGVAGLTKDKDFFWEEAPLQSNGEPASGVWIVTRGGDASNSPKQLNLKTTVDIYVAFGNKVKTEATHEAILTWIINNSCICELSGIVGGITYEYSNIRIRPTVTPANSGVTENGLVVKVASVQLTYDKSN